jgi:hypothetical protein
MFGNLNYKAAVAVVPHDTNKFTRGVCQGIYVGGAGNVAAVMEDGTVATFTAPPVGSILPIRATRVNATNTTATLMLALY